MFVDFDQFVYGSGELELAARVAGQEIHSTPYMPNPSGSVSDGDHAFRVAEATRRLGFPNGGRASSQRGRAAKFGALRPRLRKWRRPGRLLELYGDTRAAGKAWSGDWTAWRWIGTRPAGPENCWTGAAHCARRNRDKEEAVAKAMKDANDS